jgi:iron complex outermembrane receptor protein
MKFRPTPIAAALAFCAPQLAMAQAAQDNSENTLPAVEVREKAPDAYDVNTTPVASKTDTPLLLTPQSVQVVPRAVLNEQKALTLTDAIRNVAGTGSDFGFNGSAQPLLMLRGFQTESMTAMGTMSGMSTYYINGVKVKGLPINMANVDAVEVVKGPASVLYGRAEPGGLINVVPRALSATPSFGFEQTVGQYGLSRTLFEGGGALNEDRTLLGRASLSYEKSDSSRDFVEDQLGAFSGSVAWVPDASTRVALSLDRNAQKYRNDFGIPADGDRPADLPFSTQFNDAPDLSSFDSTAITLDAQTRIGDAWTLKGRAVSVRGKTHEVDIWPWRVDMGMGPTAGDTCADTTPLASLCRYYFYVQPDGRVKLDQATIDLTGDVHFGGLSHKLLAEVEHYQTSKTGTSYFQQIGSVDVQNPALGNASALDTASSLALEPNDRQRWTSLVLQDQVDFGHGWHGVIALRHDRTEAIYSADPTQEPNQQNFTTPRIGAVWAFAPQQSLYAQYQDAVSANNGRDGEGNALPAERAEQIEMGWKQSTLDGRFNTTVSVYQLVKRNRADNTLFPYVTTTGEARSRGLEIDALGQVSSQLSLMGSYAYMDAVMTEDANYQGTRLANTARHSGSLWGRWKFDSQWAAGAGVFFQSQRQGDQANTFQLPGYGRVDAMLSYGFRVGQGKGTLQFNLKNVFDKVYYSGSHQYVKDWIQPGTPRTASLTLRMDF